MGKKSAVEKKATIVASQGKKKTFAEESDEEDLLDAVTGDVDEDNGVNSDDDGDYNDAPEEGGTNEAEMQRLREMFEQHAPKDQGAKKKKKRKARPVVEVDESEKIDEALLADIDDDILDSHKRGKDAEAEEHENSDAEEDKKKGLRISKNKRSSKKIGDLEVSVLKDENPISMMIKTGQKGSKMLDMLVAGTGERVEYSTFAAQKKRRPAKKFKVQ